MASYRFETATKLHVQELAQTMREEDRNELKALGLAPEDGLRKCLDDSDMVVAGLSGGKVVLIYGLAPSPVEGIGVPWALAAPEIENFPLTLYKEGRRAVAAMHERYPRLMNIVWEHSTSAIQWIEAMGFEFPDVEPFVIEETGESFRPFIKEI